ncbi:hypothetical protein AYM40_30695 [Paraburkholderia phytofirmans OLGA172]|uniref:Uncharacterized protein n=1 Tax=Paraburkholderia phytofirmans OLGA172 TaxID=1417228 RepID=A0A167WGD0_9BURK|nr:hypothetical protein [Paraburkholderia phytofirmans]ANB76563.1 hypothetical protein AYM40_30695 [Paraburkholderia phytofirmans OLGA172]
MVSPDGEYLDCDVPWVIRKSTVRKSPEYRRAAPGLSAKRHLFEGASRNVAFSRQFHLRGVNPAEGHIA